MFTLTLRAWVCLVIYDIVVHTFGFKRVATLLKRSLSPSRSAKTTVAAAVAAVDRAAMLYFKPVLCLQRSSVLVHLLRREGERAELVIAYRPTPFEAHAWVELDGRIVNEIQTYRQRFITLDRI